MTIPGAQRRGTRGNHFCLIAGHTSRGLNAEALHPGGQGLLVLGAGLLGCADVGAVVGGAVLADFEFAFDAADGHAEADDAGQHGALEALGQGVPALGVSRLVLGDEALEERVLGVGVLDQLERAAGVHGDVIPGRHGELFRVMGGRDVGVRSREDDERFVAGEGLPVRIGLGEVAFNEAVRAFVFDDERQMRGGGRAVCSGTEEYGEGMRLHQFKQQRAVGDGVECGRVHKSS